LSQRPGPRRGEGDTRGVYVRVEECDADPVGSQNGSVPSCTQELGRTADRRELRQDLRPGRLI
jgi:hypothetical protein